LRARITYAGTEAPEHDPSESAIDVALPASIDSLTKTAFLRSGLGPRAFLVGSSDRWTLARRPFATAFSAADEEGESISDAPCRRSRKEAETPFDTSQDRFSRRLVKGRRFLRSGAPSIDECSLGAAFTTPRTRARHPKLGLGRPSRASDAPSPPANGGLDTAAFAGSSPASARRHASLVDFCNRIRSQARPSDRRNSRLRELPTAFAAASPCLDPLPPCEGAGPRSHGSGAGDLGIAMPAPR
jgi:hypothetical protein